MGQTMDLNKIGLVQNRKPVHESLQAEKWQVR